MQTTRIITPALNEIAQPTAITLADLLDITHPVNIKGLSGKRDGMSCLVGDLIYVSQGSDPSSPWRAVGHDQLHFGAASTDTIVVSTISTSPSYITGLSVFGSSSEGFDVLDATGKISNLTGRVIPAMTGTFTFQMTKGGGSTGQIFLWSESSFDDGVTWTPNAFSLRKIYIGNNDASVSTKTAAINNWVEGQQVRWAMYNAGADTVTIEPPQATVNTGQDVTGFSFFFSLAEV